MKWFDFFPLLFSALTKKRYLFISLFTIIIILLPGCKKPDSLFPLAEDQGLDPDELVIAFNNARVIEDLQGLAVARNGIIVAEEYYTESGSEPDSILHVMSVTKSVTSTLVGIAIEMGYIESVDQTVSDFLGAEVDTVNPDLGNVSLRQLMTMTNGHGWHELEGESEFGEWVNAPDQLDYIVQKPIINRPGTLFNYSDGSAHLVSVILTLATGMSTSSFANHYLFDPMGLGKRAWYVDNRQFPYGGVGLCIGIEDMIKLGFLYLNKGTFNGQRIVPPEWINTVTSFKITTGNVIPFLTDYGYFWWLGNAHGHDFICANGYGGQFIFIVKELELVVCSRTNYRGIGTAKAGENWYNLLDIIINQILPAAD